MAGDFLLEGLLFEEKNRSLSDLNRRDALHAPIFTLKSGHDEPLRGLPGLVQFGTLRSKMIGGEHSP